jgi:hypothetical protein
MSTQRRENGSTPATKTRRRGPRNRWQRTSCAERAGEEPVNTAPITRYGCACANGGTAPPVTSAWFHPSDQYLSPGTPELATNSLLLDYRKIWFVRPVRCLQLDIRRGSPPPGVGWHSGAGTPATLRSSPPHIPLPPAFARISSTLPQFPAG